MRSDVVKMYKDVHSWVGIVGGLLLFIAFYAGAITMFEEPIARWASPPAQSTPLELERVPELVDATIAEHPEAARGYRINVETGPQAPARMSWIVWPEGRARGAPMETWYSTFGDDGSLRVTKGGTSAVGQLVDTIHQHVGLPFPAVISRPVMGFVALLYAIALISGVIVLLPSLVKDLFALRLGRNLKRMWLDVHNVLGVFSLPLHIVMALTAMVFAFHDQIYDAQDAAFYDGRIAAMFEANETLHHVDLREGVPFAPAADVVETVERDAPGFTVRWIDYRFTPDGEVEVSAAGSDPRHAHRGPTYGFAMVNAYTGEIMATEYLPGHQDNGYLATITSFFALHFGNFGGAPVRWGYFVLGLAGAFLFYSGNILWIETRRKKRRRNAGPVEQSRSTRILGSLTVGVSLGCIIGISTTIAAAKILPAFTTDAAAWHWWIYFVAFFAAIGWAFRRGPARGAVELLVAAAATTLLIPMASLASALDIGLGWNHAGSALLVDLVALIGAACFILIARQTASRIRRAPEDSVWYAVEATDPKAGSEGLVPAE